MVDLILRFQGQFLRINSFVGCKFFGGQTHITPPLHYIAHNANVNCGDTLECGEGGGEHIVGGAGYVGVRVGNNFMPRHEEIC